ncbi:Alcohol dehydrogenase superfamily, zinc-type [Corchorus capsularis]|uniref:Alcohol dehydrogenase superfamily, zinc-type n=1 Tax=Corchorus capsularis TaxID=210143 RepID=A0A1R3GEY8_COCAP|nr:Alcohol dehydrogenase superfamily, zinc-type [Corchorus capsularis]
MEGRRVVGLAARDESGHLSPYSFTLRKTGPEDVLLKVLYCGVDHSDLHQMRGELGPTNYPLVPGHEVVGEIVELGSEVNKFKIGDKVGVGCIISSCGECYACESNNEQYCSKRILTYADTNKDGTPTQAEMEGAVNSLDYILDTVPAFHDLEPYISILKVEGKLIFVGVATKPLQFNNDHLILGKKSLAGSFIGSMADTQEILDFWAEKGLTSMVEVVKADYINKAFERMEKNDVRYRFVLDVANSNLE